MQSLFPSGRKTDPQSPKKKIGWKDILLLQLIVAIYTLSGVASKFASDASFFSLRFFLLYGTELFILGVYALLWQQIIKRFDLSVAYANRSIALVWSLIWAVFFFHEQITVQNIIGVLIVMVGTFIVNNEGNE